jgi:hypothetical protein
MRVFGVGQVWKQMEVPFDFAQGRLSALLKCASLDERIWWGEGFSG